MTSYSSNLKIMIRVKTVQEQTGLGRSTIYKKIKAGQFPAQKKLGKRASGWLESDVQNWINETIEGGVE